MSPKASKLSLVVNEIRREAPLIALALAIGTTLALSMWTAETWPENGHISGEGTWEWSIQLFAGNWPSSADHKNGWFAIFVAFRMMLVLGVIAGAWAALVKLRDLAELSKMKLSTMLADRDFAIEMAVSQSAYPNVAERRVHADRIHRAIEKAAKDWLERYVRHIAPEDAERIRGEVLRGTI